MPFPFHLGIVDRAWGFLFGDDIFISYSRADGAAYSAKLASELTQRKLSCRFDQWGSKPGAEVPAELLSALSRSRLLIVVSTAMAGASAHVEKELRHFIPTGRPIVLVDLDGTIRAARWWPLVEGLAVSPPEPLDAVTDRVDHTVDFMRRNRRLGATAVAGLIALGLLTAFGASQAGRATAALMRATEETRKAQVATTSRQQAESTRDEAQTSLAITKQSLTVAETALATTKQSLTEQTGVAESRELARLAENARSADALSALQTAMEAVERAPTDAARIALVGAIDELKRFQESGSVAFEPHGRFAAAAGRNGGGVLVDLERNTATSLCGSPFPIMSLSFSPNGKWLVLMRRQRFGPGQAPAGNVNDWSFEVWRTDTGTPLHQLTERFEPKEPVPGTMSWSPDSSRLFLSRTDPGDERAVWIAVDENGAIQSSRQDIRPNYRLEFTFAATKPLFLASDFIVGGEVSLWNYHSGKKLWSKLADHILWIAFASDDSSFAFESFDAQNVSRGSDITWVDVRDPSRPAEMKVGSEDFDYLKFPISSWGGTVISRFHRRLKTLHPDALGNVNIYTGRAMGRTVALLRRTPTSPFRELAPLIFDPQTLALRGELNGWDNSAIGETVRMSADGSLLGVIELLTDRLSVWDLERREKLWSQPGFRGAIPLRFSDDSTRILAIDSQKVSVFNARTGAAIAELKNVGEVRWLNANSTKAIAAPSWLFRDARASVLSYWDVDRGTVLRSITMADVEQREADADAPVLKQPGTATQLLEIARRRLRACGS